MVIKVGIRGGGRVTKNGIRDSMVKRGNRGGVINKGIRGREVMKGKQTE